MYNIRDPWMREKLYHTIIQNRKTKQTDSIKCENDCVRMTHS